MNGNTGWLYNKKYFGILNDIVNSGTLLIANNNQLTELPYDEFCHKQLIDEREKSQVTKNSYCSFKMQTCYPGLITGIGMNHQTSIRWTLENGKSVPEYKLGMYFDHTTGMPYIPGSSVKGMLRSFFPILNQKGICDNYETKCQYIASIIERIIEVESKIQKREQIIKKSFQEKLISYYEENKKPKEDQTIESFEDLKKHKENQILELWEFEKISDIEFDRLSKDIDSLANRKIELKNTAIINKYFKRSRELRNKRDSLKKKAIKEYEISIQELENRPLSNNPSAEWINQIPFIALEIFEGKQYDKANLPSYSKDIFFDAIPTKGDPHGKLFEKDYITRHDHPLRDPNPICFIKIRSKVEYQFFFRLQDGILSKKRKLELFKYLLRNNGIGAKTNIGYGQLQ